MAAKRLREGSDDSDSDQQEDRRMKILPSFATALKEATMGKFLEKNLPCALESLLRRVVCEEVEQRLVYRARSLQITPQKKIQAEESSRLHLRFGKQIALPIFTGSKIEDEENNPLQIILADTHGGSSVTSLPSLIKVQIVVINGDFPSGEREDWTSAEFKSSIVKERAGKRPLITGDVLVTLRDGSSSIGELMFTDNSSWIKGRHFKLGARVAPGSHEGLRIREAVTDSFMVKDHRGEFYKKHYPPSLHDEVWRLNKIGKDGVFHKKLKSKGINTVQDMLKLWVVHPDQLRGILLDGGRSSRIWEGTIKHARTCALGSKLYLHQGHNFAILLNPICQVVGAVLNGLAYDPQNLARPQMTLVEQLVLDAYRQWDKLEEVDGASGTPAILPNELMAQGASTVSNYQIGGLEVVETFQGNVPMEISGWPLTPSFMTSTTQPGHGYNNMPDMSSDDDGEPNPSLHFNNGC